MSFLLTWGKKTLFKGKSQNMEITEAEAIVAVVHVCI